MLLATSAPHGDVRVELTDDEAARVSRMRREVDRAGHATARRLATDLLQHADPTLVGRSRPATVCDTCGSTAHGRPKVDITSDRTDSDVADSGWQLSWAHSDELVVVALATVAVGVDTEPLVRAATLSDDVGALLPHPAQGEWRRLTPQARLRHWVSTEAVLKAAGLGLGHAHRVTGADLTPTAQRFRLGDRDFHVLDATVDGQLVAVATAGVPRIEPIPGFDAIPEFGRYPNSRDYPT